MAKEPSDERGLPILGRPSFRTRLGGGTGNSYNEKRAAFLPEPAATNATTPMSEPIAYLNGQYVPRSQLWVSVDDPGFLLGVTVSERLRTFRGQLFQWPRHLRRLEQSLRIVAVETGLSAEQWTDIVQRVVEHNGALRDKDDDLGLVLFVTPGVASAAGSPTVCVYTDPLPWSQFKLLYEQGQPLAVVDVRQVPEQCWPLELKCRSRMHYYLADREANRRYPGARALLLDLEGFVTEASTANVLIYRRDEGLISPPPRRILPGVTLEVNGQLAAECEVPFVRRDFTADELQGADEILLCSTSPCLWPALQIDGRPVGDGQPGPIYRQLLASWTNLVGIDLVAQAQQNAAR